MKVQIDLSKLNRISNEANASELRKQQLKLEYETQVEKQLQADAERDAYEYLNAAGPLCESRAARGERKAAILSTKTKGCGCVKGWGKVPEWNETNRFGLCCKLVCEALDAFGTPYNVEYEHDGLGMESWYVIYIIW